MSRSVKFGISLPTTGSTASPDTIGTVAERAERIGLDTVWSFERLLSPTAGALMNGQTVPLPEAYNSVFEPTADGASATGSPEQIVEAIPRLERIGVTELLWNFDEDPVEDQLPRLAELVGASV